MAYLIVAVCVFMRAARPKKRGPRRCRMFVFFFLLFVLSGVFATLLCLRESKRKRFMVKRGEREREKQRIDLKRRKELIDVWGVI